ncbi:MAG: hypothetical protein QUV05_12945 [Phycisphaerae bacterium]|nr:hypothetical protein [Phycisphaerae bacterium]
MASASVVSLNACGNVSCHANVVGTISTPNDIDAIEIGNTHRIMPFDSLRSLRTLDAVPHVKPVACHE